MKKRSIFLVFPLLMFSILSCNFIMGGFKSLQRTPEIPTRVEPAGADPFVELTLAGSLEEPTLEALPAQETVMVVSEFPLPEDASQVLDLGDGGINFQTGLPLADALEYYRVEFRKAGYTERETNTAVSPMAFSLVFDGHSSGRAIVIQAVDLNNGRVNISIRFEDV